MAAPLESEDPSDHSRTNEEDPVVKRCRRIRTNSENESDIPVMQRQICERSEVSSSEDNRVSEDLSEEETDTDVDTDSVEIGYVSSENEVPDTTERMQVCGLDRYERELVENSKCNTNGGVAPSKGDGPETYVGLSRREDDYTGVSSSESSSCLSLSDGEDSWTVTPDLRPTLGHTRRGSSNEASRQRDKDVRKKTELGDINKRVRSALKRVRGLLKRNKS